MTDREYTLLAKRLNQRIVTAINLRSLNPDGFDLVRGLEALGMCRFPEKLSWIPQAKQTQVLMLANKYAPFKKLYGPVQGHVKEEQRRSVEEIDYVRLVRKVNARMDQLEREGYGSLGGYQDPIAILKMLYDSLEYQGINSKRFPLLPAELPPSADLKEIVNDFTMFLKSPLSTAGGRRHYLSIAKQSFGGGMFDNVKLSKVDKVVLAFWVSIYQSVTHPWLVSDQIIDTVIELDNSGRAAGGMGTVRQIQRMAEAWHHDPEGHRSWYGYLAAAIAGQLKHFKL